MEAVDSHRDALKPLFDVVSVAVVELTAQSTTNEGSQIATGIDQKLGVCDVVFLGEPMQEPVAVSVPLRLYTSIFNRSFDTGSMTAHSHFGSPSPSIHFSSTATRDGIAVGGSS